MGACRVTARNGPATPARPLRLAGNGLTCASDGGVSKRGAEGPGNGHLARFDVGSDVRTPQPPNSLSFNVIRADGFGRSFQARRGFTGRRVLRRSAHAYNRRTGVSCEGQGRADRTA